MSRVFIGLLTLIVIISNSSSAKADEALKLVGTQPANNAMVFSSEVIPPNAHYVLGARQNRVGFQVYMSCSSSLEEASVSVYETQVVSVAKAQPVFEGQPSYRNEIYRKYGNAPDSCWGIAAASFHQKAKK